MVLSRQVLIFLYVSGLIYLSWTFGYLDTYIEVSEAGFSYPGAIDPHTVLERILVD